MVDIRSRRCVIAKILTVKSIFMWPVKWNIKRLIHTRVNIRVLSKDGFFGEPDEGRWLQTCNPKQRDHFLEGKEDMENELWRALIN